MNSPVCRARGIDAATRVLLAVAAGGCCEFPGCNKFVFEDPLTFKNGNFSEMAHIVAFSEDGPRGKAVRPKDVNDIRNLMLLCQPCHKRIDDNPDDYPRKALELWKREHEERIHHLCGLGPKHQTTVVQLKAPVAGQAVDIPIEHVHAAVAPRYPSDRRGHVIDLNGSGETDNFIEEGSAIIEREVRRLYEPGMDVEKTRHVSLFAIAPLPLLFFLGSCLSNAIPVDLFQRHRSGPAWQWRESTKVPLRFRPRVIQRGTSRACVALTLPMSGAIKLAGLPRQVDKRFWVYEIGLVGRPPAVDLLKTRAELEAFRTTYRALLSRILSEHGEINELHVFPAVPPPIAVACGHDLLPKVHPTLLVYDNDRALGGYTMRKKVNER